MTHMIFKIYLYLSKERLPVSLLIAFFLISWIVSESDFNIGTGNWIRPECSFPSISTGVMPTTSGSAFPREAQ